MRRGGRGIKPTLYTNSTHFAPRSFQQIPRLPKVGVDTVSCISTRLFLGGTCVLVLSDSNGVGGLAMQLVDVKSGGIKEQVLVDNVCSGKICRIDLKFCPSSATEVAVVGCVDGGLSVWTFYQNEESLPRRPIWRMTSLAHGGEKLIGLSVDVTLRLICR